MRYGLYGAVWAIWDVIAGLHWFELVRGLGRFQIAVGVCQTEARSNQKWVDVFLPMCGDGIECFFFLSFVLPSKTGRKVCTRST